MAGIKLTKQQEAVINDRGGNLLVSAAAGAGKTKVLVDRIMKEVCEEGKDIDSFLVITYTKAAAAELRAKVMTALSERMSSTDMRDASYEHISHQLLRINSAKISTVHAYCSTLLRAHSAEAGLPSDFRVAEEQEAKVLRSAAMEDTLEALYKDIDKHPDKKAFVEELAYGRDDSAVPAIIYSIYDTIQAHPWPAQWVAECLDNMDVTKYTDAAETPWGAYIVSSTKEYIRSQLPLIRTAQDICDRDEALSTAYSPAIHEDAVKLEDILNANWDSVFLIKDRGWAKLKSIRKNTNVSEALQEQIKSIRTRYKKAVDEKLKGIYGPSKEVLADLQRTESSIRGMFALVADFDTRFQAKKEANNVLDFSDLEHMTIRLLLDETTHEKTNVAKAVSATITEVMVDEFQDTNGVQEAIFNAISNGKNRFMVGDVKQSIYRFRLADPTIFLSHYNTYKDYTEAADGEPRRILLSENFRSRAEILDATNAVMETCMSETVGGLTYGDDEALKAGRTDFIPTEDNPIELVAIDTESAAAAPSGDEDMESVAKVDIEAKYVASRIRDMLDNGTIMDEGTGEMRSIRAKDVAILMQAPKRSAAHYIKALADVGIAAQSAKNGSIMDTTEIATLYAFLQVLDSPTQDIPLVAMLASPLVGFTADELAQVRIAKKDAATFYEALQVYAEKSKKAEDFVKMVTELRSLIPHYKLSQIFSEILYRTDAEDVFGAMSNGEQRMANVHRFSEMIAGYEAGGARGLFEFICYMEALREQGTELPQAACSTTDDAVTIMSIHSSKGLEFPIVFLTDTSRRFNSSDLKASALLHKELGAGVQAVAVTKDGIHHRYPTIARNAISSKNGAEAKSEYLRILYVAMTRAKQKLIMTYCDKLGRTLQRLGAEASYPLPSAISQSVVNPGSWILLTALCREEGVPLQRVAGTIPYTLMPSRHPWNIKVINASDIGGKTMTLSEIESSMEEDETKEAQVLGEEVYPELDAEAVEEGLSFTYQYQDSVEMPAKLAATNLTARKRKVTINRPDFAKKKGLTAAERGTATHSFMQYANYAFCAQACLKGTHDGYLAIEAEIRRMLSEKFITADEAKGVYKDELLHLFKSDIGQKLGRIAPNRMRREFPFALLLPAKDILGNDAPDDDIMVQGIIDMFLMTDDGIEIVDFKTDYVSNTDEENEKAQHYASQLGLYEKALKHIYNEDVVSKSIIFLHSAHSVSVS